MKIVIDNVGYSIDEIVSYFKNVYDKNQKIELLDNTNFRSNKNYNNKLEDCLIFTSHSYNLLFKQYYAIYHNYRKEYLKWIKFYNKYLCWEQTYLHIVFINKNKKDKLNEFIKDLLVEIFIKNNINYLLIDINDKNEKENLIKTLRIKNE